MNILLTGASGFIGHAVLRGLLKQGHRVNACCRNPERILIQNPRLTTFAIDFATADSPEIWFPYLQDIDAMVNAVGIIVESGRQAFEHLHTRSPIALFEAASKAGVTKIVQLSALGADEQAESAYHLSKKAADDALRKMDLNWYVLQPSIVYGAGARSTALFQALAALPVHVLPDGGAQRLQPIHVDDMVLAVCNSLSDALPGRQTLALVGVGSLTYAELLLGLRRRLGKKPAISVSVPFRYALSAISIVRWLKEPMLSKDNIAMLQRGNSADTQGIAALLGHEPLGVSETLLDLPATPAECWQASLYFTPPLLRLGIAVVWLWSGITSLFCYPHVLSYGLLEAVGVTGWAGPLTLYGLAFMDIAMGLMTLLRYRTTQLMYWQIGIVLVYSLVVATFLPEFIFHPFGPLLKNIPFVLALWIYLQLEGERP